jgi:hypothetical protein
MTAENANPAPEIIWGVRATGDGALVPPRHHLRLVLPPPSPRPRRLEVRISVADGRAPHGRSRLFRLIERHLDELIAVATRLEFRSSRGAR